MLWLHGLAAFLLLVGGVRASWPGPLPGSINVRDFGAVGDGVADDTRALQAAADAAMEREASQRRPVGRYGGLAPGTKSAAYPEIYFPEGVYRISEPVLFQQSLVLRGEPGKVRIRQEAEKKDIFYFHYSFRVIVDGLGFEGGAVQLRFWTGNIWSRIVVANCRFENAGQTAVECDSYTDLRLTGKEWNRSRPWPPYLVEKKAEGGWSLAPNSHGDLKKWYNSTLLAVEDSHFEQCRRAVDLHCDTAVLVRCTVVTHPEMEGGAFRVGSQIQVHGLKGVARVNPARHQVWFETEGNTALRDLDLDAEGETGIALVHSRIVPTATFRGLRVENARVKAAGCREGALVLIRDGTHPNLISLTGVREAGGQPIKAVAWEGGARMATLEKLKQLATLDAAGQYRIAIGHNGPEVETALPEAFAALADEALAPEVRAAVEVPPLVWSDAPAHGKTWQVIDATAHGVRPDTKEDQSDAIQRVFDLAASQPDTLLVFPGAATYHLSRAIRVGPEVRVTSSGVCRFVQENAEAPVFHIPEARKIVFNQLNFVGGKEGLLIRTRPDEVADLLVDRCAFYDIAGAAIRCEAGDELGPKANRTSLLVRNAIIRARQGIVTNAAQVEIEQFWAFNAPHLNDAAFFENHGGAMRIGAMLGNPVLWAGKRAKVPASVTDWPYSCLTRWVDNWGRLFCQDNRFGGEAGGMCHVYHRAEGGTVYIGGGLSRANNGETRQAILFLEKPPAQAVLDAISIVPAGPAVPVLRGDGSRAGASEPGVHFSAILSR